MRKDSKGRKWDGKSRISTNLYCKRFNEITWKNIAEVAEQLEKHKEENLKNEKKR